MRDAERGDENEGKNNNHMFFYSLDSRLSRGTHNLVPAVASTHINETMNLQLPLQLSPETEHTESICERR